MPVHMVAGIVAKSALFSVNTARSPSCELNVTSDCQHAQFNPQTTSFSVLPCLVRLKPCVYPLIRTVFLCLKTCAQIASTLWRKFRNCSEDYFFSYYKSLSHTDGSIATYLRIVLLSKPTVSRAEAKMYMGCFGWNHQSL